MIQMDLKDKALDQLLRSRVIDEGPSAHRPAVNAVTEV